MRNFEVPPILMCMSVRKKNYKSGYNNFYHKVRKIKQSYTTIPNYMKNHKPFVNLQNYFLYGDGIYKGDSHDTNIHTA